MKTRSDRFNVEWTYTKQVWDALAANEPVPPVALYSVFEINEKNGTEKLSKRVPCSVMRVTVGDRSNVL